MYLSDRDIKALLPQLNFEAADPAYPFNADEQVQPCSVDLRLDGVFWKPTTHRAMDLRRSGLLEIQPRRYYRKIVLRPGESISVRPGKMLLGRVYEKLSIPNAHTGEIVGRSSFARLGLMVHCTGGFINPGYRGHMPLQLVNFSPNTIRLFPYLPMCQLRIAKLTSASDRLYGEQELQSKYMDDDGGPSYWWRDKRIRQLHTALGKVNVAQGVEQELLQTIGHQEPEIIERLERHLDKMPPAQFEHAQAILESFCHVEDHRQSLRRIAINVARGLFVPLVMLSLGMIVRQPFTWLHYMVWGVTPLSLPLSYFAWKTDVGEHLGERELRAVLKQ